MYLTFNFFELLIYYNFPKICTTSLVIHALWQSQKIESNMLLGVLGYGTVSLVSIYVISWNSYHFAWASEIKETIICWICLKNKTDWSVIVRVNGPKLNRQTGFIFIFLSITNRMQRYTIFFITVNALHVSRGFTAHHKELKNCTHNSPTLTVAASKLDVYPMLCVQFLSSWWWAEKPPETCRALTVIKNIV
jgi:hypothetical protein